MRGVGSYVQHQSSSNRYIQRLHPQAKGILAANQPAYNSGQPSPSLGKLKLEFAASLFPSKSAAHWARIRYRILADT